VHVSAFPRDGGRPRVDEPLSFEIEHSPQGKKRAANVRRPVATRPGRTHRPYAVSGRRYASRRGWGSGVALALVVSLGAFGYAQYTARVGSAPNDAADTAPLVSPGHVDAPRAVNPRCDGRLHCSQMTSCAEAKFFLANCPGVQMDGDRDGIPCEQQWCTGPLGR
jgi:hypothetical protein